MNLRHGFPPSEKPNVIGLADGFIHPADLVAIGVVTAAEAEEFAAMHPSEKTT